MIALGKRRNAALKLFAVLNIGKPVSHATWNLKNIEKLVETSRKVIDSNMGMAAKEVHSINDNNRYIESGGVSFDCTWNSRRWQTVERVVAAIAHKTAKIIYTVRKTTYCRDCEKSPKA